MVTNKLNIGSRIKVDFGKDSRVVGNGEKGTVISMYLDTVNNEILYTADLDNGFEKKPCCEGGLPINSIQFREGQYQRLDLIEVSGVSETYQELINLKIERDSLNETVSLKIKAVTELLALITEIAPDNKEVLSKALQIAGQI